MRNSSTFRTDNTPLITSNCYNFKELHFKYGIYDNSIDVSYILTLKNSPKIKNIHKQLTIAKPTKKIFIVVNDGFKKCAKDLHVQNKRYDTMHSYIEIFKHAKKNNYQNILILEDNFIFDKEITYLKHTTKINDFCSKNKNEDFILSLGSLPIVIFPYNEYFNKSIISTGTYSMIYSRPFIDKTLNQKENVKKIHDWDYYTNKTFKRYIYYIPLCTQLFNDSNTDIKNEMPSFFGLKDMYLYFIKRNKLDKQSQPGFNNFYFYSKIISIFMFILLFYIIYLFYKVGKYIL